MKRIGICLFLVLFSVSFVFALSPVEVEKELLKIMDEETIDNIMRTLWLYEDGHYKYEGLTEEITERLLAVKNHNKTYGELFKKKLIYLLNNPDSFTPDYTSKYNTYLKYTDSLSPQQAYALTNFLGLDSDKGYAEIPPKADIQIPADHAIQFDFQVGWHFFVGLCEDYQGNEYGVQLMFWRNSLLPTEQARQWGLSDEENQMIEMHLAISKAGDKHYSARPTIIGGASGLMTFKESPFTYTMGANSITSLQKDAFAPLRLVAKGWDDTDEEVEIEIDITIVQNKKVVLNGDNGASPSIGGVGTLYYSITNMKLFPDESYLKINGEKSVLKDGKFWFDHQWANGLAPTGNPRDLLVRTASRLSKPAPPGWDWFMMQFEDETEIGLSAIHIADNRPFYYQDGEEAPATMTVSTEGKYVDKQGNAFDIKGEMVVSQWVRAKTSPDPDRFWVTNVWYPNHWAFSFEDNVVPEGKRHFSMVPIVEKGQYAYFASGMQYSEGGTYIYNEDNQLIGRGFAESVSYADTTMNMLALTGMPVTEEVKEAIKTPEISDALKARALKYIGIKAPNLLPMFKTTEK